MTARISLPGRAGPLDIADPPWGAGYPPPASRRVYAAAHVASVDSGDMIDWEATLRFRDHLWAHGFAVAEAMDTAQRGMGLSWGQARELIASSAERAAGRAPGGTTRRSRAAPAPTTSPRAKPTRSPRSPAPTPRSSSTCRPPARG